MLELQQVIVVVLMLELQQVIVLVLMLELEQVIVLVLMLELQQAIDHQLAEVWLAMLLFFISADLPR